MLAPVETRGAGWEGDVNVKASEVNVGELHVKRWLPTGSCDVASEVAPAGSSNTPTYHLPPASLYNAALLRISRPSVTSAAPDRTRRDAFEAIYLKSDLQRCHRCTFLL